MNVIIKNQDKSIVLKMDPKIKFRPRGEMTSEFKASKKQMEVLIQKAEDMGYNRYALFSY